MTFSVVGRCERTGSLGVACATSDIAIGSRVPFAEPGVGAVATQHRTDPRLGRRVLDLIRSGASASEAVAGTVASTADARWRQLAAIASSGPACAWSGSLVEPSTGAELASADHAVIGNILADTAVGTAISTAFGAVPELPLAERLLQALESGLSAGGESSPLRSAVLLVVRDAPFPLVDLRVDENAEPLRELRRLWELYQPWAEEFVRRALTPDDAAGVPEAVAAARAAT